MGLPFAPTTSGCFNFFKPILFFPFSFSNWLSRCERDVRHQHDSDESGSTAAVNRPANPSCRVARGLNSAHIRGIQTDFGELCDGASRIEPNDRTPHCDFEVLTRG